MRETAGSGGSSGGRHFLLRPFRYDLLLDAGWNATVGMKFQGEGALSLCQTAEGGRITKGLGLWDLATDQDSLAKHGGRGDDATPACQVTGDHPLE